MYDLVFSDSGVNFIVHTLIFPYSPVINKHSRISHHYNSIPSLSFMTAFRSRKHSNTKSKSEVNVVSKLPFPQLVLNPYNPHFHVDLLGWPFYTATVEMYNMCSFKCF